MIATVWTKINVSPCDQILEIIVFCLNYVVMKIIFFSFDFTLFSHAPMNSASHFCCSNKLPSQYQRSTYPMPVIVMAHTFSDGYQPTAPRLHRPKFNFWGSQYICFWHVLLVDIFVFNSNCLFYIVFKHPVASLYFTHNNTVLSQWNYLLFFAFTFLFTTCFGLNRPSSDVLPCQNCNIVLNVTHSLHMYFNVS
jgi:hypothetical protein